MTGATTGAPVTEPAPKAGDGEPRILEMRGIVKTFPGVRALDGVDLDLKHGEVLAVLGENGAGKSTLMKILGGDLQPDAGTLALDGRTCRTCAASPRHCDSGIAIIHQELEPCPTPASASQRRSSARPEVVWGGPLRLRELEGHAREGPRAAGQLGVGLDVRRRPAAGSPSGQRQIVEIATALPLHGPASGHGRADRQPRAPARWSGSSRSSPTLTRSGVADHLHLASPGGGLRDRRPRPGAA